MKLDKKDFFIGGVIGIAIIYLQTQLAFLKTIFEPLNKLIGNNISNLGDLAWVAIFAYAIYFILGGLIYIVIKNYIGKSPKTKTKYVVIAAIVLLLIFFGGKKAVEFISGPPEIDMQWQEDYRKEMLENNIDLKYTQAQSTIDYVTPELQEVIEDMDSTSAEDAVKKATRFVLKNVKYNSKDITADFCYKETATSTYLLGQGDCVSMTKLGAAILRGQGVAIRSVGGCWAFRGGCDLIMGAVPLTIPKADIFDGKKRGYLHEWAEVWIPEKGWVTVDFTNGAIYEEGCDDYIIHSYDEGHYKDMCVITDRNFNKACWSS